MAIEGNQAQRPTVLCVDRDPATRGWLCDILADFYRVLSARDLDEALQLAAETAPAVAVINSHMSFDELMCLLVEFRHRCPQAKRIVIGGSNDARFLLEAINTGQIFHCLPEPWNPASLRAAVTRGMLAYQFELAAEEQVSALNEENDRLRRAKSVSSYSDNIASGEAKPVHNPLGETKLDGHVLLAEDNADSQRLIYYLLTSRGARVTIADNGEIAVDLATETMRAGKPFDCVLMDIDMPVMNGYDATQRLRAIGYSGPVIAISAHSVGDTRDKALTAGCNDYLSKPLELPRFLDTIARHMASAKTGALLFAPVSLLAPTTFESLDLAMG